MKHILFLFLLAALLPCAALAGQTVTIDDDVTGAVYGNGVLPGGTLPAGGVDDLLPPDCNTLIINAGTVGDNAYGGYAKRTASAAASDNRLTLNYGT